MRTVLGNSPASPSIAVHKYEEQRLKEYRHRFRAELIVSAVPVFLGVLWSRAFQSLFRLPFGGEDDTESHILVSFAYAVCVHALSAWIIYQYHAHVMGPFVRRLATECTGFAWTDAVFDLILHRLTVHGMVAGSAGVIAVCVFGFLYVEGFLREKLFTPGTILQEAITLFHSEVFALSVSYSVTQTFNSIIFGRISESLYIDDDSSTDDSTVNSQYWILFGYAVGITCAVGWAQHLQDQHRNGMEEQVKFGAEYALSGEGAQLVGQQPTQDSRQVVVTDDEEVDESSWGDCGLCFWNCCWRVLLWCPICLCICCENENVKRCCFRWDTNDAVWNAMKRFWNTTLGYLVGCAWYIYSVQTFAVLFNTSPAVLGGSLAYAAIVTFVASFLVARWQLSLVTRALSRLKMRRRIVLIAAFRLTVGWAWGEVVNNFLNLGGEEHTGYRTTVKIVAALLLTIIAVWYEIRVQSFTSYKPATGLLDSSYLEIGLDAGAPQLDPLMADHPTDSFIQDSLVQWGRAASSDDDRRNPLSGATYGETRSDEYNVV